MPQARIAVVTVGFAAKAMRRNRLVLALVAAMALAAHAEDLTPASSGHVRWGASGSGGWHFPFSALLLGAEGRIGYQFNDLLSGWFFTRVAVQFRPAAGPGGLPTLDPHFLFGALAEFRFGELFWLAGGPALGIGPVMFSGPLPPSGRGISYATSGGLKPGIDVRLGFGRRGAFMVGLEAMILFHPQSIIATQNAGSLAQTNGLVVSAAPMLLLGYDSR